MAKHRRRYNVEKVLAAQISGLVAGYVQVGRLTRDEARAGIVELVSQVPEPRRRAVLSDAAVSFVGGQFDGYARDGAALQECGADLEVARTAQAAAGDGLTGFGRARPDDDRTR